MKLFFKNQTVLYIARPNANFNQATSPNLTPIDKGQVYLLNHLMYLSDVFFLAWRRILNKSEILLPTVVFPFDANWAIIYIYIYI